MAKNAPAPASDGVPPRLAQPGNVLLVAPDGATGCSVAGVQYDVDEGGILEAPCAIVAILAAFGYRPRAD